MIIVTPKKIEPEGINMDDYQFFYSLNRITKVRNKKDSSEVIFKVIDESAEKSKRPNRYEIYYGIINEKIYLIHCHVLDKDLQNIKMITKEIKINEDPHLLKKDGDYIKNNQLLLITKGQNILKLYYKGKKVKMTSVKIEENKLYILQSPNPDSIFNRMYVTVKNFSEKIKYDLIEQCNKFTYSFDNIQNGVDVQVSFDSEKNYVIEQMMLSVSPCLLKKVSSYEEHTLRQGMPKIEEKKENKKDEEKSENNENNDKKENEENKDKEIKKDDEKEKEKEKIKITSPKKEIKEKKDDKKIEKTPAKKDIKNNTSNNNTEKKNKDKPEIKINKTTEKKPPIKKEQEKTKKITNDENLNNNIEKDVNEDENEDEEEDDEDEEKRIREKYEEERIRRIMASLEKYRIKEPVIQEREIIKPVIKKQKKVENKSKDNNIKSSEKKIIKSEIKTEKKNVPLPSSEKKEKDQGNNNNKDFLKKKREREEKEKTEKKNKVISSQKKEVKKAIKPKKVLDDEEDEDDSYDEDYDEEDDKSYSEGDESESSEENYSSESSKNKKPSNNPQSHKKIISKSNNISTKKESGISSTKKITLKPKGILVNELLKRWWYALPPWPPENYDTSEKLKENKLRLVKIADWKKEPKLDKDNFEKCFELTGYKYVYLNNDGKIFDLRPEEGKPSYNNFIKLPDVKLHEYLLKALKGQLEELEKRNSVNEKELRQNIKEKIDKEEKALARLK